MNCKIKDRIFVKIKQNNRDTNYLSRRIEMNVLRITLVVAALLCIAVLSGCHEEYAKNNDLNEAEKVYFQPTGTGFWYANP